MTSRFLKVCLFLLCVWSPSTGLPAIITYDNCEAFPNSSLWRNVGAESGSIVVSSEQARAGNKSWKFILKPYSECPGGESDSHCKRTEFRLQQPNNFEYGQEYWIGWSVFIPSDFIYPSENPQDYTWALSYQYHAVPDSCDAKDFSPTAAMYFSDDVGDMLFTVAGDSRACHTTTLTRPRKNFDHIPINKGQWNDFVHHVRWGYEAAQNPLSEIWVNGVKYVSDTGANCWNDTVRPFLKVGIYAIHYGQRTLGETPKPMILYWDEIRVGDANSSYAEVSPGGAVAPDPLTISTTTLGSWTQGSASSGTLSATGGTTPYRWYKVSGPSGLTVTQDTGAWSITPDFYGSYNVQIRCTDDVGNSTTKIFTGTITQTVTPTPPSVTAFDLPSTSATLEIPVTAFTGSATTTAYMILESPGTPLANDSRWSVTAPTSVTAADVGNRTFYAYVKDADGQVSAPAIDGTEVVSISIDTEIVTGWTETVTDDVWSAACSITPKTVYFDSAIGIEVTALVDATSPHVWYYSAGTGTLYTYSATDPDTAYTTITASTDVAPDPVTPAEGVITTGGNKTITTTGEKALRIR